MKKSYFLIIMLTIIFCTLPRIQCMDSSANRYVIVDKSTITYLFMMGHLSNTLKGKLSKILYARPESIANIDLLVESPLKKEDEADLITYALYHLEKKDDVRKIVIKKMINDWHFSINEKCTLGALPLTYVVGNYLDGTMPWAVVVDALNVGADPFGEKNSKNSPFKMIHDFSSLKNVDQSERARAQKAIDYLRSKYPEKTKKCVQKQD